MANSSIHSGAADGDSGGAGHLVLPDLCTVPALSLVVLVGEFLVLVLLFAGPEVSWMRFALLSLFVQWVALISAGGLCLLRARLARMSLVLGAAVALALVAGVTLLVGLGADRLLTGGPAGAPIAIDALFRQQVIAGIIALLALRYFHVQQQLRLREQAALRARIQALQSRIRPHFLFNSMNSIASLIATDPETAEAVVEDLAELFRASLSETGHEVWLGEELALCRRYLRIEGLRLGARLRVDWQVPEVPAEITIPLLTLQPLLENAVQHGIQPRPDGGTIGVRIALVADRVEVEITNPLGNADAATVVADRLPQGNRMALGNIRDRLAVLYGAGARLETANRGDRFVTTLSYPARPGRAVDRTGSAA